MKPYVKNNRTGEVCRSAARRLHEADLPEILRVQQAAAAGLADPSLYVPSDGEAFRALIAQGDVQGLFAAGELAGVCAALPSPLGSVFADDACLPPEALARSVTLECYFVAPDFAGNGIARELAAAAVQRAFDAGAQHVLATVSPKNGASLVTLMQINGFRIVSLRQKYGCRLRYVLCNTCRDPRLFTYYERYDARDVFGISRGLANGWVGLSIFRDKPNLYVWLAK